MATKLRLHKTDLERIQREQEEEAQAQAEINAAADAEIQTIAETWPLDPREVEIVLRGKYRPLYIRAKQAQRDIERNGLTLFDKYGRGRVSPAVVIERDSISGMMRILKQLNIGMNEPPEPSPNEKPRPWSKTR